MEAVAVAGFHHVGDEVFAGFEEAEFFGRLVGEAARGDGDLVALGDDDLLGHVADALIEHHHDGDAELFGQVEGR